MMFRKRVLPVAIALALSGMAQAADVPATKLPEVVVTGAQPFIPQSSYQVDLGESLRAAARDSSSLIEAAPGAAVVRNGTQTGIVQLRGLTGDRVNVLVDGMDITPACPNHMDPPLHYITAEGLESLEVIAGITPVSQGGDAIAGSVIAKSATPQFGGSGKMETFGRAAAGYNGSNNGDDLLLRVGGANDRVSIAYTGERQTGGDVESARGKIKATGFELNRHDFTLATKAGDGVLRLDLGRHESSNVGTPSLMMDMVKDNADKYALGYAGNFAFGTVEAKVYRHEIDHLMDNYTLRGLASGTIAPATSNDTGYQTHATLLQGVNTYRLGAEYLTNDFNSYTQTAAGMQQDTIRNGSRDRFGVYGEWESRLGSQWKTLVGLRSDTVKTDAGSIVNQGTVNAVSTNNKNAFNNGNRNFTDNNWDFTAQAKYTADATSGYEIAFARKTRSPNLVERYIWTPVGSSSGMADGKNYIGNLDLKPEVSHQVSVGADWHGAGWQIKPSLFYNKVNDYIQGVAGLYAVDATVLKYTNIDAELYGVDGSWKYDVTNNLGLSGIVSYVRGKRTDVSDNLYRLAPLRASINADYAMGQWNHRAEWQLADRQDKVSANNSETATGGYALFNLRTSYRFDKKATLNAGIENLFDRYYADHLGGINRVSGSVVAVGEHLPGAGRFGYVSADYRW